MRPASLLLLVVLAACSSSSNVAQSAPAPETVRVVGGGSGNIAMGMAPTAADAHSTTLPASVADVWRVLPAAYEALGIQLSVIDSGTRTIGNSGFNLRRRLGSIPLVRLIDCGTTQGGPSAETYDIHMSVVTQVRAGDAGTIISTTVEPMGKPVAFSGEYIRCSSTGVLESRLADAVRSRLTK
jgi:hypothetical protein